MRCLSTRPKRRASAARVDPEAEDLVRVLMRKFSDREPLLKTMDKYVRVVRTEHCFLLFEELGKTDKWTQCLEVSGGGGLSPSLSRSLTLYLMGQKGCFMRFQLLGIQSSC